jgi:hypothetical protein
MARLLTDLPGLKASDCRLRTVAGPQAPLCQTSCRPIMIAEYPHRSAIYEQKFIFN